MSHSRFDLLGLLAVVTTAALLLVFVHPFAMAAYIFYSATVRPEEHRLHAFAWLAFTLGVLTFNALRSWTYGDILSRHRVVYEHYVIVADRAMLGDVAPILLQRIRQNWLDWFAFALHISHFFFFVCFAATIWRMGASSGLWVHRALLLVFWAGLVCYFLVPTVPPWLASEHGMTAPIPHAAHDMYRRWVGAETIELVDTNPVAAMPSLHVAVPVACATVAWWVISRWMALLVTIYCGAQAFGVMYLGEHYFLDVLAGAALGIVAAQITKPRQMGRGFLPLTADRAPEVDLTKALI